MSPDEQRQGRATEADGKKKSDKGPGFRFNMTYFFLAFFAFILLQNFFLATYQVAQIPYSQFRTLLGEGKIAEVAVTEERLSGRFKEADEEGNERFVTVRVQEPLYEELAKHQVEITGVQPNEFLENILSWVIPLLLFVGVWIFLMRRFAERSGLGGGFMSVGKSKAKIYVETDTKTRFDDVAGADEAKAELEEIVQFLKDPSSYGRLGARIPKGILLVGPPGTGKTLLARAVAGEAQVIFFSISGSEFVEMFVGVGAARVRDLFEQARQKSPCIIFIDELDALGKARGAGGPMGGHDEKEQTLNQLLVELDGFDVSSGIVLLAATNRPEILDPALLRSGRFDRQILVDRPDRLGREAILRVHVSKVKMDANADLAQVAALTTGFTGADLANLVNEAALVATRRGGDQVTLDDFTKAIERIVAGLEKKNRLLNPKEREIVAHHEMGHAIVSAALPGQDVVHKVSIVPRGIGSLGYTIQRPTEDRYLMTRSELVAKMAVLLGGRAAEALIFAHKSTGAADDIAKATDIARTMVTQYGMSEGLGSVSYEASNRGYLQQSFQEQRRHYSEETAREIDCAVRREIDFAGDVAATILRTNRDLLESSAKRLLLEETLDAEALKTIFANVRKSSSEELQREAFN